MIVGFTDLFPAISGSTVLMIFGKYYDLFYSLNHFISSLISFKKIKLKKLKLSFTLPLFTGIIFSVFIFSRLAEYLFESQRSSTIIFITTILLFLITRNIYKIDKPEKYILFLFIGILLGFSTLLIPENLFNAQSYLIIFISGLIAISFMIIPGISGSLMLIALGTYESLIKAISNLEISFLIIFMLGGFFGIFISIKLISKILFYFQNNLTIFFYGLILGSLPKFILQISLENYFSVNIIFSMIFAIISSIFILIIVKKYEKNL
jgi:putative membrane protein